MRSRSAALLLGTLLSLLSPTLHANAFVHLFEWRWDDIAQECEQYLGPNGYTAVQISPPNEHRLLLGRPWYERYQPVSYKLTSRSGDRAQFQAMIRRCHAAGVAIYADAVINHMASCRPNCDTHQPQYGSRGVAGSRFCPGSFEFDELFDSDDRNRVPGALSDYRHPHFHHQCNGVSDWNNSWQVQNCELERLADLATEREDVRATLANYLASLFALGVDGLRIDAAKHMPAADLHAILEQAASAAGVSIEGTEINPGAPRRVLVFQEYIGAPPNPQGAYGNGKVTEFNFGQTEASAFLNWNGLTIHRADDVVGESMQPSDKVVIFIDNHDNQRGHGGGGAVFAHKGGDGHNYGIRNDLPAYRLANIFMLAYPYGYPKVMSSYTFGNGELWDLSNPSQDIVKVADMGVTDDFIGPPHDGAHQATLTAADYANASSWQTTPVWEGGHNHCLTYQPSSGAVSGDSHWLCEHRWPGIAGMVGFRAATTTAWQLDHLWDGERNRIAFGRGDKGFVVINGELWSDETAFGPEHNGWFQTGLAAGAYCDVVHSRLAADGSHCIDPSGATLAPINVTQEGKAQFMVNKMDAVAIHVGARLGQ